MNINGNVTIDYIWELHNKKSRTSEEIEVYWNTRRENPELDRALYNYDKAEIFKEITSAELYKSFILGYDLSSEEIDAIKEEDPNLFEKSLVVRAERQALQEKIHNANNIEDIRQMLSESMIEACEKGKEDSTYLEFKKVVINDLRNKYGNSDNLYNRETRESNMINTII